MVMLRYDRYKLVVHICRPISSQKLQELGSQVGMIQSEAIMHSLPTRGHRHVDFKTKTTHLVHLIRDPFGECLWNYLM